MYGNGETELAYYDDDIGEGNDGHDSDNPSEVEANESHQGSIESDLEEDNERAPISSNASIVSIRPASLLADLTREQLQDQARERVRQQLEDKKKKDRQRGAFRKRNSNKTYLKGKRVYNYDLGM